MTSLSSAPETPEPHATLDVSVNGEVRRVPAGVTLDRLVATLSTAPSGVAAAVNEAVVPRGQWAGLRLAEGDRVEVLTAVQGG
ncbi:sulfur carrier protein ThiS [Streptomyces sp. HNM0574]|uniref:sulfur carrier protein ThiS n=1 Tax=Streptomyces sp. HNM0574 TaxID=2714954 RepID=UPI00146A9A59|nr:sulfur carrier protein ThiS [Streptomyces sp. HNM0574]NLU67652.1 sulfur carrier protein ThiS [Streptomyces sp. HNM0574]